MDAMLLFRKDNLNQDEYEVAKRHFNTKEYRSQCRNSLVIGRYSVLPFYRELTIDLAANGGRLINTFEQHRWIANLDYYQELRDYTFETYSEREFPYVNVDAWPGIVVKGRTNSRKHHWNTMMFARTKPEAVEIATRLYQDDLISQQGLVYRKYCPLVTYEIGLNGLPFTNEWRCFFLGKELLAHAYYWSEAEDIETPKFTEEALAFVTNIAEIVSEHVNFFVLDVGEKQEGGWVLIEVNDGQMSGLSMNDPDILYGNLARAISTFDVSS